MANVLKPTDLCFYEDDSDYDVVVGYVRPEWVRPDGTVERALFEIEGAMAVLSYMGEFTWVDLGDQIAIATRVGSYLVQGTTIEVEGREECLFDLTSEISEGCLQLRVWVPK